MTANYIEDFMQLEEIESIIISDEYTNMIDISVEEDESFMLSNGIVSHNSAKSSFRKFRDPQKQGAFPLKGKFINVSEIKATRVIENTEAKNLIAALGLHLGLPVDINELRYQKIYITADADVDGDAISALLINFFYKFWPELFQQGRIYKVYTPLLVAKKAKVIKYFYYDEDYEKWATTVDLTKWNIEYKKGLASLEDAEYRQMIQTPEVIQIKLDQYSKLNLECWFGNNSQTRKDKLLKR